MSSVFQQHFSQNLGSYLDEEPFHTLLNDFFSSGTLTPIPGSITVSCLKASPTYTWLCAESFLSWKSSRRNLVGIQETCVFLWQETWCFYLGLKTDSSPNFTGVCHDPSISGKAALSHTHVQYAILITITVCLRFLLL